MYCPLKDSFFCFQISLTFLYLVSWRWQFWFLGAFSVSNIINCTAARNGGLWITETSETLKEGVHHKDGSICRLLIRQDGKWRKKVYQGYKLTRFLGDMHQSSQKERIGSKNCTFGCLFTNSHIWCVLAIISMQKWKASITILPSRA